MEEKDRKEQRDYVRYQSERVSTLDRDHLHSNAYLQDHIDYLRQIFKQSRLRVIEEPRLRKPRVFLQYYAFTGDEPPLITPYTDPDHFTTDIRQKGQNHHNAILFMQGQPSPQWLIAVGTHFDIDIRFFNQHLGFLSKNQRDWFAEPSIPSRSMDSLKLSVPSIIFVGAAKRFMTAAALREWRASCKTAIEKHMQLVQTARSSDAGQSLLRQASIFVPDCIVAEQDISINIRVGEKGWRLFIWSDAGDKENLAQILFSDHCTDLQDKYSFCPTFFNTEIDHPSSGVSGTYASAQFVQPLLALASDYGRTLDWTNASKAPILAMVEMFRFHASASMQCLNMLEQLINETLLKIRLGNLRQTKLEDVEVFEYAQISLQRYIMQYDTILRFLKNLENGSIKASSPWIETLEKSNEPTRALASIREDLDFIRSKAQMLSTLCDSGRSTVMSHASVQEALGSNEQAQLVTQLSKITYRLTFIFLPLSYVASLFGMNFRQFGQGELDLWIWAAITVPLLIGCIIYVECGAAIQEWILRLLQRDQNQKHN